MSNESKKTAEELLEESMDKKLIPTFFEHIGLADLEKVHSNTLAWIFSEDCNALHPEDKIKIINDIFNLDIIGRSIRTFTEYKNIDIVFKIGDVLIVIENKFKTGLHENQLENYEEEILKELINNDLPEQNGYFYYLTLYTTLEKLPKDWQRVTYDDILKGLSQNTR